MEPKASRDIHAPLRTLLFCAVVLLVTPTHARDSTDIVVMRNGDRFTCQIKALSSGVLYASFDYIDGTVSLQWSKVARLESKQLFLVKTQDGFVYTGTLDTKEGEPGRPVEIQVIEAPDNEVTLDRARIVNLDQTSEKFWQRFNGEVNWGIIYSKGNQSTQYSLGSEVVYPRERWSAGATFTSTLSSSSGTSASTRNVIGFGVQRLLRWDNWFYTGLGDFLQSTEQGINLQTNLAAGIGRYVKNTNRASITVIGGFGWQNTKYNATSAQPNQNVAVGLLATQVKLFKFKKTNLNVTASLFPAISQPGRAYFVINASYYVKLFSNLSWTTSFYGNWDSRPPGQLSGSDYGTNSGLSWTFGNR